MRRKKRLTNNYESVSLIDVYYVDPVQSQKHPHMLHHHTDVLELLYVSANSGQYIVGDYEYSVNAGDIIICNAGILHGEDPFQEHRIQTYCLVFTGVHFPNLPTCHAVTKDSCPIISLGEKNSIVADLLPNLYKMFHAGEDYYETCLHLALGVMLMTRQMIVERDKILTTKEIKQKWLMQQITDYINQHYTEPLTLKQISDEVYISENYLSHLFKREAGLSPMQYMMQRRMGEAQSLLVETSLQIAEISDKLGFSSDAHFSKMFKKYVGTTPKDYRQYFSKRYQSADNI